MNQQHCLPTKPKKERLGRWSTAQSYLFEELLERYGKNWKKIQDHMKGRTLSQIRSHAQKFFDKVGVKKVNVYERRAKLLEAMETLQKEKRRTEIEREEKECQHGEPEVLFKEEEEQMVENIKVNDEQSQTDLQTAVKEPVFGQIKKEEGSNKQREGQMSTIGPFLYRMPMIPNQSGYLIHLICLNPDAFSHYGINLNRFRNDQSIQQLPYYPEVPK